jgi:hypothetical protein
MKKIETASIIPFIACNAMGTERLGEISRFRKCQGRSADLLRSENRPSAPPGTFPARGGALRYQLTRLWASMKVAVPVKDSHTRI